MLETILVADHDRTEREFLSEFLHRHGYQVRMVEDGEQALAHWRAEQPHLVLIQVDLPVLDGFAVCQRIRRASATPVILLAARPGEEDTIRGLDVGADDYLTKPISPLQLVERIRAVLRRAHQSDTIQRAGEVVLDTQEHTARHGERPAVQLTPHEFRLLSILIANAGRVVPFSRLADAGWDDGGAHLGPLKTHIGTLRRKLALPAAGPAGLRAIRGLGYTLAPGARR